MWVFACRYASGCCVEAVQQVLSGAVQTAMAVVRPPGHHAECGRAMGFCFFNNTVVAARAALQHPGWWDNEWWAGWDWELLQAHWLYPVISSHCCDRACGSSICA